MKIKLIQNLSSYFSTQVLIIIFQLISVPVFLKLLGTDSYGELIFLTTIPGFLLLGEAGFGTVVNNEVIFRVSKNKINEANKLVVSSICLISIIYNLISFTIIFFFYNLNYQFYYINDSELLILFLFFWIGGFVSILFGIFQSYLRADNFHHINVYWTNFTRLIEIITPLILLFYTKSLFILFLLPILLRLISFSLFLYFIKKRVVWFNFHFNHNNNLTEFVPYISKSLHYFLFTFGQGLLIQGSTWLVGYKLGNTSLVQFNTIRTLVNAGKFLLGIINNSFLPEFTKFISKGQNIITNTLFFLSIHITFFVMVLLTSTLFIFGELIINLWTDKGILINKVFFNLLTLELLFFSFWFISSNLLVSINKHEFISRVFAILSLFFFIITYLLIDVINITAVPVALIIMDLFMIYYVFKYVKVEFKNIDFIDGIFNFKKSKKLLLKLLKSKN
tara:strand:- start:17164 stop:18510 length:1347 start_codon:yes stop_codon:yes gene_type:complete